MKNDELPIFGVNYLIVVWKNWILELCHVEASVCLVHKYKSQCWNHDNVMI